MRLKNALIFVVIMLFTGCTQKYTDNNALPKLTITKSDISSTNLQLEYKITNITQKDVWVCDYTNEQYNLDAITVIEPNAGKVIVSRSAGLPSSGWYEPLASPVGKFVCVAPGTIYKNEISLELPIDFGIEEIPANIKKLVGNPMFKRHNLGTPAPKPISLRIEIGYFKIPLKQITLNELKNIERTIKGKPRSEYYDLLDFYEYLLLTWNPNLNEDNIVYIPYLWPIIEKQQILIAEIGNLEIPAYVPQSKSD